MVKEPSKFQRIFTQSHKGNNTLAELCRFLFGLSSKLVLTNILDMDIGEIVAKSKKEWLDGWMDGWMDGWKDGWLDYWLSGWTDGDFTCYCSISLITGQWDGKNENLYATQPPLRLESKPVYASSAVRASSTE